MPKKDFRSELKRELDAIKERNKRVEADKAWETSKTRRGLLALTTYVLSLIVLIMINAPNPALTALVPAVAYVLSTPTLPFFKRWWVENVYKR